MAKFIQQQSFEFVHRLVGVGNILIRCEFEYILYQAVSKWQPFLKTIAAYRIDETNYCSMKSVYKFKSKY